MNDYIEFTEAIFSHFAELDVEESAHEAFAIAATRAIRDLGCTQRFWIDDGELTLDG